MKEFSYSSFQSPLGEIEIKYDNNNIYSFHFVDNKSSHIISAVHSPVIQKAHDQLHRYFNGNLQQFDLPLKMEGTVFQKKVWSRLCTINFGKTISYLELAIQLEDEKCIRAAASANGKNPFAIIVPCHRVIGKNGNLTGYAGQLWRKQWLLDHEARITGVYNKLF
ncbi:MAG: methylated-DNA/protein-cysteine methyltransferase [Bacteroidetes bacterium]|nr:methylated-DNA/protein-cysteine methyltransferase [Bacteroidota bacterium]